MDEVDDYVVLLPVRAGCSKPPSARPVHLDLLQPPAELWRRVDEGIRADAVGKDAELGRGGAAVDGLDEFDEIVGVDGAADFLDDGREETEDKVLEEALQGDEEDCARPECQRRLL